MIIDVSASGQSIVHVIDAKCKKNSLALKNFGQVLDIQFCGDNTKILLATTTISKMLIHQVTTKDNIVECALMLELIERPVIVPPKIVKTIWCPYRSKSNDHTKSDFYDQWVIWIRGKSYLMFNLTDTIETYGVSFKKKLPMLSIIMKVYSKKIQIGVYKTEDISDEIHRYEEDSNIVTATVSKSDETLVLGLDNGSVKFIRLFFDNNQKKVTLLREWVPHVKGHVSDIMLIDENSRDCSR